MKNAYNILIPYVILCLISQGLNVSVCVTGIESRYTLKLKGSVFDV